MSLLIFLALGIFCSHPQPPTLSPWEANVFLKDTRHNQYTKSRKERNMFLRFLSISCAVEETWIQVAAFTKF